MKKNGKESRREEEDGVREGFLLHEGFGLMRRKKKRMRTRT
jgi:hypothetical protein